MKSIKLLVAAAAFAVMGTAGIAGSNPTSDIFDELPDPNHLRTVLDSDRFLNYHVRTFVQVATFRRQAGAQIVQNQMVERGYKAEMFRYRSRKASYYVVMIMVTSREAVRSTLRGVRRSGYRDAFVRNYTVPRK